MDLTQFSPSSALITVVIIALAPFVAVMITSFTKIVVVLSLLRNALGLQQVPPNLIINGLALVLSIYVMYPVSTQIYDDISQVDNSLKDTASILEIVNSSKGPMREFLAEHANLEERQFFLSSIKRMTSDSETDEDEVRVDDFIVLIPAFTISELTAAFQIGFLIFLPFIVIDLVIANILMAMGMMMLSPTVISLPFKLLLFVLVDGWAKLAHGLVLSYL
ncbi:MAG: type III secretion system export apparatus subunit SctR [Candidatus Thiodiazotropha sp. (ex. Lucinisca nassula)]|nr:type III secretion system export apparatus subunit SctR [Candidatus Thiodiazotropha sp. (ex. Lucinisca nassula)]